MCKEPSLHFTAATTSLSKGSSNPPRWLEFGDILVQLVAAAPQGHLKALCTLKFSNIPKERSRGGLNQAISQAMIQLQIVSLATIRKCKFFANERKIHNCYKMAQSSVSPKPFIWGPMFVKTFLYILGLTVPSQKL